MNLDVTVDPQNQKVDMWACLTSGCIRYEERQDWVSASIEDKRKDGLKAELSVTLNKRRNCAGVLRSIFGGVLPAVTDEPKADEKALIEIYKFALERDRQGARYIGVKSEFFTPRGIEVYYRLRAVQRSDGYHIVVELIASKDSEKLVYQCFGTTNDGLALKREAARAIALYILFSDYVAQPVEQGRESQELQPPN
jgi:hypothetical protein